MDKRLTAIGLALALAFGPAQAEDVKFEIRGFRVEQSTLLPDATLQSVLAPYTGNERDFSTIQLAMSAIESAYGNYGYGAVKAILPEQEIEDGIIRLQVVEATLGEVEVSGNQHFSTENVRRSLPSLLEGSRPNLKAIDASLRVANESAAKQTTMVLRQGSRDGVVDAVIRVADEAPLRMALSIDNTASPGKDGNYPTGRFRTGFIVQHANLFDRDHALSLQYLTSPEHPDRVKIFGLGYRIPLYRLGDAIELVAGYSNVDSGRIATTAGPINISGKGQVYALKYDQMLPRLGDWNAKLTYAIDYRRYQNNVGVDGSESLIPDAEVHPLSLTYGGNWSRDGMQLSLSLGYHRNVPGGRDGTTEDFRKPGGRAEATASYSLWRFSAGLNQNLPGDWMAKAALNGQYTADALISGEQFGVGGQDSVRGFEERELSNDIGVRGGVEIHSPELFRLFGREDGAKLRIIGFYDQGWLKRNKAQPGEVGHTSVASAGIGLRGGFAGNVSLRLDLGWIIQPGATDHRPGDYRVHGALMFPF